MIASAIFIFLTVKDTLLFRGVNGINRLLWQESSWREETENSKVGTDNEKLD